MVYLYLFIYARIHVYSSHTASNYWQSAQKDGNVPWFEGGVSRYISVSNTRQNRTVHRGSRSSQVLPPDCQDRAVEWKNVVPVEVYVGGNHANGPGHHSPDALAIRSKNTTIGIQSPCLRKRN